LVELEIGVAVAVTAARTVTSEEVMV